MLQFLLLSNLHVRLNVVKAHVPVRVQVPLYNLPLKGSMKLLSVSFLGREKSSVTPLAQPHRSR
jgi:hypothetical protein